MLTREQVQGFVDRATKEEKRVHVNHFALAETALSLYDEVARLKAKVSGYEAVLDTTEIAKRQDRLEKLERVAEAAKVRYKSWIESGCRNCNGLVAALKALEGE